MLPTAFLPKNHPGHRLAAGLCFVCLLVLGGCIAPLQSLPTATPSAAPEIAYNFTLNALDGSTVTLNELRGRWVLINFWATWCGPCRDEMPYLQQLSHDYANRLTVLGVNMREAPSDLAPFLQEIGVDFPILLNPADEMLLWYGPRGLPLTYVIAPDGTVAHKQFGALDPPTFDAWLAAHLDAQ